MMTHVLRWRLAVAYGLLVILLAMAFWQVDKVADQVEEVALERSALLERESLMRANNLCVQGNELRAEIVTYLQRYDDMASGEFIAQECPPPPLELEREHEQRLEQRQEQREAGR